MIVPLVLILGAINIHAAEIRDGVSESACTLDIFQNISLPLPADGSLKISGCRATKLADFSLPVISMLVRGSMSGDLGIVLHGQVQKAAGTRFIISNIVDSDMKVNLRLQGSQPFHQESMVLFALDYM